MLRATPFHARAAAANRGNAWVTRNGTTLAGVYTDAEEESLAARTRVAVADISWRWRVSLEGPRAEAFLQRLVTRDAAKLSPGQSFKALWLSDGGGVRGAGIVARYGTESFRLVSTAADREWIEAAAAMCDATMRGIGGDEGGLSVIGPYARATLRAAGLDFDLEPLMFRKIFWRGSEVALSRWGEHDGYEIWCGADDAFLLWDRLMSAGAPFGILPVGVEAMQILDLEAGVPRPGLDYTPARNAGAVEPSAQALGLSWLIDDSHWTFNGRAQCLAKRARETGRFVGIRIDSETPAPHTPLLHAGAVVGRTMSSERSPALRCAIALAIVDEAAAKAGTALTLTLPPSLNSPELRTATARVVDLPFLPPPQQLAL